MLTTKTHYNQPQGRKKCGKERYRGGKGEKRWAAGQAGGGGSRTMTRSSRTTREHNGRPGIFQGLIVVHLDRNVDNETIAVGGVEKKNITINHAGGGGGGTQGRRGEERKGEEMR